MRMHNPPHPGEILSEMWLAPMGMSVTDAAAWLKLSRKTLSELLNGRASVTLETAVRFELATGKSAQSWLGHQAAFDDWHADELRRAIAVRPWDTAMAHRAAIEDALADFMASNGLRAIWYQGDKLLRMQSVKGGAKPAPIVVNFPDEFWQVHDKLGKRGQRESRMSVVSTVQVVYQPKCAAQFAQEVTAEPRAVEMHA